jgi:tol-pal system protein YbgF
MKTQFQDIKTSTILATGLPIFALVLGILSPPIQAADWDSLSIEERVTRLERILSNQSQSDILIQVQRLQKEVQTLRGKLEVQAHTLETLSQHPSGTYGEFDTPSSPSLTPLTPLTTGSVAPNNQPTERLLPTASPVENSPEEQAEYQRAFGQLRDGQYNAATKAFRDFLNRYPNGQYADNAQYWLGETFYVTRDFDAAILAFNQMLEQHPDSPKRAGATLKLGFIYHEKGQIAKAQELLGQILQQYPDSTEAQLAQQRLELIRGRAAR